MRFQLYCRFNDAIDVYHKKLLQQVREEFGCDYLEKQQLPAHFILKNDSEITTEQLEELQQILQEFAFDHAPSFVYLKDIELFSSQAIFASIQLSEQAQATYFALLSRLEHLEWLTWKSFEKPQLHFHYLLAYQFDPTQTSKMVDFLKLRIQHMEGSFDHIGILIHQETKDGIEYWEEFVSYPFTAGVIPNTFTTSSTKSSKTK